MRTVGFVAPTRPCVVTAILSVFGFFLGSPLTCHAEEVFGLGTLQNDFFLGKDGGGYTNGIYGARIRMASVGEEVVDPPFLLQPISGWLGVPLATLSATSVGQGIATPSDLTRRIPDPNDTPYVGTLTLRTVQVHVHDDAADMVAINLGVIGPAAGGKEVQSLFHRVSGSTQPEGWDSQGGNRAFAGLERYKAWRWASRAVSDDQAGGQAHGDAIVMAGGTLGNLETSAGGTVLLRYGQGLARSFPTVARVTGPSGDPFVTGRGWFTYAGLSASRVMHSMTLRSDTDSTANRLRKTRLVGMAGLAYGWNDSSLSFSLRSANPLTEGRGGRQSYASITYVWRIR